MMDNKTEREMLTKILTVKDLVSLDQYVIPLYQRNFAWGSKEIEQLLWDIHENKNDHYYLGTLVVYEESKAGKKVYEVIDGQQRLTAIHIILSILTHKTSQSIPDLNMAFESRDKSNNLLRYLREKGELEKLPGGILESFQIAVNSVNRFIEKILKEEGVQDYLTAFYKVEIFRVQLHPSTDKNHYFEVMNNRGEQLEAHEIVKAKLMDTLKEEPEHVRNVFATVWDACSDMNTRLDDNEKVRHLWGTAYTENPLSLKGFEEIVEKFPEMGDGPEPGKNKYTFLEIDKYEPTQNDPQSESPRDELDQKYSSVIDFPNFLLQVLEVKFHEGIQLDASKFLLSEFGCIGRNCLPDAKDFLFHLFRLRVLFDKFIIKRKRTDKTKRGWKWAIEKPTFGIKKYYVNTFGNNSEDADNVDEGNEHETSKQMCMLQAMFFVTFRRDVYMRWLTVALQSLDKDETGFGLMDALQAYSVDFFRTSRSSDGVDVDEYRKGTNIHHYVFNFLDYQLWCLYMRRDDEHYKEICNKIDTAKLAFQNFIFTRRNSIEHYLAQEKGEHRNIDKDIIDDFGNLSLISGGLNSRLSNRDCKEKKEYHDPRNPASLKYELMLAENPNDWGEELIKEHGKLMVDLLRGKTKNYFKEYDKR